MLLLPLFLCNACRVQQIYNASLNLLAFELPNSSKDGQVIQHFAYTVSYNSKNLTANWVAYELTADETNGPWSRKGLRFSKTQIAVGKPMTTIIAILVIHAVIWHQLPI